MPIGGHLKIMALGQPMAKQRLPTGGFLFGFYVGARHKAPFKHLIIDEDAAALAGH